MSALRSLALTAIVAHSTVVSAAQPGAVTLSHYEPLQRLEIGYSAASGSLQAAAAARAVALDFDALGRSFDLRLAPNLNLFEATREIAPGVVPYRGQLAGHPDSWVRIVIADGMPSGLIWDGRELFAVEAGGNNVAGAAGTIIYRLADAAIAPGAMSCGSGGAFTTGGDAYGALVSELKAAAQGPGAVSEIAISTIGDFEFTSDHGAGSQAAIVTRMNNVDGIFSQQVGVQITVPVFDLYTDAADPFTDEIVAGDLLDEVADFRQANASHNDHGLTHLWTGKNLSGSTVGIAFTGALCSTRFGAALSEGRGSATFDSLVAAHEIGHNFGAPHDAVAGSACENEPDTFLMAAQLNGNDQFSQCSLDQMADDVAGASCITPLPSVDMRVAPEDPNPTALLGNSATITIDLPNAGTLPATNVAADFTIPANVSLVSAAASQGSCTNGAGIVNCAIGDVGGLTTVSVTISTNTLTVGPGDFDVTVSSDVDDNTNNNQRTVTLTVLPAVDLVFDPPPTRQVDVDQSTTISTTIGNTSMMDANDVVVSISLAAGLQADSATWSAGACTVQPRQVDCFALSLAAQSNSSFSLTVTALTEGSKSINIAVSSLEADSDPSDNNVTATVIVGNVEEDDGGGSTGLLFLLMLAAVTVAARKSRL